MFFSLNRLPALFRHLLLLSLPVSARASEASVPGISGGSFLQAMLALLLIIGILLATAWMARKVSGGKGFGQGGMEVIGGVALGPRERIVLVEVGDVWLVIGIVPGQIRTLHQMPKGTRPLTGTPGAPLDASFANWLKAITERRSKDV